MNRVRIVTDSTCDIPLEVAAEYGITIVPLYVNFGDESFREGVEIDSDEIINRMESEPIMPKTSQPSPGDFFKVYQEIVEQGDTVISLHISGKLSGTVRAAETAKDLLETSDIHVIDTNFVSMGLGRIAIEAAKAANNGSTVGEILEIVDHLINTMSIYFVVGTLDYLERGGRIGKATAFLGSLLKIAPILYIDKEGLIVPVEKTRGKNKAIERIGELIHDKYPHGHISFDYLYGNDRSNIDRLKSLVEETHQKNGQASVFPLGAVVICHAGPDVFGVIVWPQ